MSKLAKALTAAAGNAGESLYVEDVFSTYLYEGTGVAQTITNGIDLDGEGGLVWAKSRTGTRNHILSDTERGTGRVLFSNLTAAEDIDSTTITSYNSDGFSMGSSTLKMNTNGEDFASWTFRKAEKFFDVVTYTGNGGVQNISHNLGAVPAVIIVKNTQSSYDWGVYTASTGNGSLLLLNSTSAAISPANQWNNTTPTDTVFTVGNTNTSNRSGQTYVAYLFASDAGGFGDDGSESIIKCGSYTGTGAAGLEVDLGFEPQFLLVKNASAVENWGMFDLMRDGALYPNTSGAEIGGGFYFNHSQATGYFKPLATGFRCDGNNGAWNGSGQTHIYIAIRRPMKTPESGTEVFSPNATTTFPATMTTGFPVDLTMTRARTAANYFFTGDRLRGNTKYLSTATTNAEAAFSAGNEWLWDSNTTITQQNTLNSVINYNFKRATGFFDVMAYTGDGQTTQTLNHNLGVTPDIIVVKKRSTSGSQWPIIITSTTDTMYLNTTNASFGAFYYIDNPTSTTFDVQTDGSAPQSNQSGETYIAYLFATLAGVSKVGSYTGTGADLNVDCGFSAGARFILIKRTDSTGDWYVYDSARGIVAGNDPYLLLNSTAAEVTSTDYIDPLSSGFTVTSSAPAALNASGGTYIFLAIA